VNAASAFRRALEEGSVADVRGLWGAVFPHLPQPRDDGEAAVMMHRARTEMASMPLRLLSGLPDELRPRAERIYPVKVEAVGISVRGSRRRSAEANAIQTAMSDKVLEMYAEGDTDPELVRREIRGVYERWRG
jgi:hypothetical protein